MNNQEIRLYPYRWVVLGVFMFANLMIQLLWISYSPITGQAAEFFNVSDLQIGLLAMVFMIAYVPLSMPVSWAIDTFGFRKAVGLGTLFMGVFALVRGFAGTNYPLVLISTIGIAISQPFLMNSWTTVPARWFEKEFRATAVGLITLSGLLGVALSMILTPILLESLGNPATLQLIYGAVAALSSLLLILLARDNPPTPPSAENEVVRALVLDGLKNAVKNKMFWLLVFIQFLGMALFNGLTTWIEPIVRGRNFDSTQAGYLGALMLVGGVVGAIVLPALSDKQHKRKFYLFIGFIFAIPFLLGITYANLFPLLLISAFGLGFFLTSASPIIMQFATEITYPTPEGTSNGILQLFGQVSVVFVYLMEAMKTADGSFTPSLLLATGLLVLCVGVISFLKDPKFLTGSTNPTPGK
ncbi:MAG TPA: MFS transporter [Longilinea sp.]|nr:MFS transporter [Longilinea sp.]